MLCLTLFFFFQSFAQNADTLRVGEIKGIVRDSSLNFVLSSATIAVYKNADSSLIQYTLPNSFGEFFVKPLPADTGLYLLITHVGYRNWFKQFTLPPTSPVLNLGHVNMVQKNEKDSGALDEVIVSAVIPMRMNGDTLEFNADAFKLDKNATAEDLIRKLPGFTIWGDEEITFNGKKINSILVNGKPFFGGDFATITQNVAKDALQTVQVYQQKNEQNPLDSTMHANLKLKEDKKTGYFGKVSAGYGSDERYAFDGMLGAYNKKMQASAVLAANNVNKVAGNAQTLIKNSTYKGVGANIDYQPDFRMQGLNRPIALGATFQYDFVPDPNYYNEERISADYFLNRNNSAVERNSVSSTLTGDNQYLIQTGNSTNSNINHSSRFNNEYIKNTSKYRLTLGTTATSSGQKYNNESLSQQERTSDAVVSRTSSSNDGESGSKNMRVNVSFQNLDPDRYKGDKRFPKEFSLSYNFNVLENMNRFSRTSAFESYADPSLNRFDDRLYDRQDALSINNQLGFNYRNLKKLIFNRARLAGIDMGVAADLYLHNNKYNDRILDWDTGSKSYVVNRDLTNDRNLDILNVMPRLDFSKYFWKQLSNRYSKYVSLNASAGLQYYEWKHRATQAVQNISYSYLSALPTARASYNNHQYGVYDASYNLSYRKNVNYPQLHQLAPLVDVANPLYIPKGNLNLKPQNEQRLSFSYNYTSRKSKNPFSWSLNSEAGKINGLISDSTLYGPNGERTVYYTNLDGNRFGNVSGQLNKSFKKKEHTFQFQLNGRFNYSKTPNYINSVFNISESSATSGEAGLFYSFKDVVAMQLKQGADISRSKQRGFNNIVLQSNTYATTVSGSLQAPKNVNWSSNIVFNKAKAGNNKEINFAIWNASLAYRFLKGNRGEAKFSMLDMLRQNKSIINTTNGNTQVFGSVNVLQQYYMLTLSYYPRKFGR